MGDFLPLPGAAPWPENTGMGPLMSYREGDRIFVMGEPITHTCLLLSGVVKVCGSMDGRSGLVSFRTPGWMLGAAPAILGRPQVATITAMTTCNVRRLPIDDFHRLRQSDPRVSQWLQEMLARDAHDHYERAAALATGRDRNALEGLLLELFRVAARRRSDGSWRLQLPISVTELSELLGVSRPWASGLLRQLIEAQVVVKENDWLVAPPGSPLVPERPEDA
jgi:CRP-like cAMP-binding protein